MRFDKFTERAQDAASRAVELLQRYGHTQVDTEHILLALLEQPEGIVPGLIEKMGGTVPTMATRLDEELRKSPRVTIYGGGNSEQVFVTPRVKKLTELAQEEANKMKDEFISTEHIFLAISSERNTPAARVLGEANITKERITQAVADYLARRLIEREKALSAATNAATRALRSAVDGAPAKAPNAPGQHPPQVRPGQQPGRFQGQTHPCGGVPNHTPHPKRCLSAAS